MQMISRENLESILTAANFINFKKLADYLMTLPDDYENFDMSRYVRNTSNDPYYKPVEYSEMKNNNYSPVCGTSACALGHGLAAGVVPGERLVNKLFTSLDFQRDLAWTEYCDHYFITSHDHYYEGVDIWEWCFSPVWVDVDNTVKGAARRIYYMLQNGIPEADEINSELLDLYKDSAVN